MSDWTADRVKDKLRSRHPATQRMGVRTIPGPWTCIEEWANIDLLAVCATSSPAKGRTCGAPYPIVGYEVKVSRADYRAELKVPEKRAAARARCHEFYFAVPRGLLRDDELPDSGEQPQLDEGDLYVPDDVGLVLVDGRGCKVVKPSPANHAPEPLFGGPLGDGMGSGLNALVRWVSARPDPRHHGVVEGAREAGRLLRERNREAREERKRVDDEWRRRRAEKGEAA